MMKNKKRNQMLCIACAAAILLSFGACKKAEAPSQTTSPSVATSTEATSQSTPPTTTITSSNTTKSRVSNNSQVKAKTTVTPPVTQKKTNAFTPPSSKSEILNLFIRQIEIAEKNMSVNGTEIDKYKTNTTIAPPQLGQYLNKNNTVSKLPYGGKVALTSSDLTNAEFKDLGTQYQIILKVKDETRPSSTGSATAHTFGTIDNRQEIKSMLQQIGGSSMSFTQSFSSTSATLTLDKAALTPKKLVLQSTEKLAFSLLPGQPASFTVAHTSTYSFN